MTREEAIAFFKDMNECTYGDLEPIVMAIKALQQEPSISKDGTLTVNVKDGNKVSRVLVCGDNHFGGLYYPEQEPCEDSIVEWKKDFKGYVDSLSMPRDDYNGIMEYIDELPVTPQPCADAISRQAVTEVLLKYAHSEVGKAFAEFLVSQINDLPPVTPQYTEAEIQKMQDLESAEIQKAYEIGKDEGSEVLDKIRVEIDEQYDRVHPYNISCAEGLEMALDIIDKYKASPTGVERSDKE